MSFESSSVVITGGSRGIGLSIAKVCARKTGHPIVLMARNSDGLEKARTECLNEGAKQVEIITVDVTSSEAVSAINFEALNPGILVNNVGFFLYKTLEQTTAEEFKEQFLTNTFSAFNVTEALLPALKKQQRALIVNICSQASLKGFEGSGAYAMSKHALLGYTRSLRRELMETQVAVSVINLGQTYSTSWKDVDIDPDKLIDPEDVGKLIVTLSELSPRSVAEEILLMPQGGAVGAG